MVDDRWILHVKYVVLHVQMCNVQCGIMIMHEKGQTARKPLLYIMNASPSAKHVQKPYQFAASPHSPSQIGLHVC